MCTSAWRTIMKRMFVAAALLAALAGNAWAADQGLPTKAPAFSGYPYAGSGFYFGIGAEGMVASANVSSVDVGTSLYSAGAALTGTVGWQGTLGRSNWYAVENIVNWTNVGGTVSCAPSMPCSIAS